MFEIITELARSALKNKVAIITGAGRGVGKAVSVAYARAGASVCCVARSKAEIEETAAEIQASGGAAMAVSADVSDLKAVQSAVDAAVRRFGGLDILVVNHGVSLALGRLEDTDPQQWRKTVEINLIGAYHCARSAIPHLKARGAGKIIIVGSGQGHQGTASTSAYSASKGGVWCLAQSLAAELVEFNISVNELLPGNVKTKLYDDSIAAMRANAPQGAGQLAQKRTHEWLKGPEDVVPLALFLACQPDVGPTAQSYSLQRRI